MMKTKTFLIVTALCLGITFYFIWLKDDVKGYTLETPCAGNGGKLLIRHKIGGDNDYKAVYIDSPSNVLTTLSEVERKALFDEGRKHLINSCYGRVSNNAAIDIVQRLRSRN